MLCGWQAYLVLKEKAGGQGHTHAFAFPSPQHSLDTEKVGVACRPSCRHGLGEAAHRDRPHAPSTLYMDRALEGQAAR